VDTAVEQITPRRVSKRLPLEESAADAKAGIARIESGDLRGARRFWNGTLQRFPNDAGVHYNLGALSEALGNLEAAAVYLKEAILLAPTVEKYQAALKDLEGRLGDVRAGPAR
jgi:Flp pilus assembly protein TadD